MSKSKKLTGPLTISGKNVLPDSKGRYRVDAATLGMTDLSTFPVGAEFYVHHALAGSTADDYLVSEYIRIMSNHSAWVKAAMVYGMRGWEHVIDVVKYAIIAEDLIRKEAGQRPDLRFVSGHAIRDTIELIFRQKVDSGTLGDIENQVCNVVVAVLQLCVTFASVLMQSP